MERTDYISLKDHLNDLENVLIDLQCLCAHCNDGGEESLVNLTYFLVEDSILPKIKLIRERMSKYATP